MTDVDKPGVSIALHCDPDGTITDVFAWNSERSAAPAVGEPLRNIADIDSKSKVDAFLAETRTRKLAVNWQVNVTTGGRPETLSLRGVLAGDRIVVIGESSDAFALADELTLLNNELATLQRQLRRQNSQLEFLSKRKDTLLGRLSTILESIRDAIIETDSDGTIAFVNPVFETLTGVRSRDTMGRKLLPILRAFLELESEPMGVVLTADHNREFDGSVVRTGRTGGRIPVAGSVSPVRAPDGTITGRVISLRDMTAFHDRQRLIVRVAELSTAKRITGGIAHTINNLVMIITGHSELLVTETNDMTDADRQSVEAILEAARRISNLATQLMHYTQDHVNKPALIDLNGCVRSALDAVPRQDKVSVSAALDDGLPRILADPVHIQILVWNLVQNAIEACEEQGSVVVSTGAAGSEVEIAVCDDGPGMDEDALARVFEPFYTTKFFGRGLGLPSSMGIAGKHGGTLRLLSTSPGGTRAVVRLPIPPAPATDQ